MTRARYAAVHHIRHVTSIVQEQGFHHGTIRRSTTKYSSLKLDLRNPLMYWSRWVRAGCFTNAWKPITPWVQNHAVPRHAPQLIAVRLLEMGLLVNTHFVVLSITRMCLPGNSCTAGTMLRSAESRPHPPLLIQNPAGQLERVEY